MKRKLMVIGLIILLISGCTITPEEEEPTITDALKFKEEYEAHNDKINENNG